MFTLIVAVLLYKVRDSDWFPMLLLFLFLSMVFDSLMIVSVFDLLAV